jgi:hypothetical protein
MEQILMRIMPQRLYTAIGISDAGLNEKKPPGKPSIQINVLPAQPAAPQGRVLTVTAVESDDPKTTSTESEND